MSTDVSVREQAAFADLESAANLPSGSISLVGLDLPATLTYDEWTETLRGLGHVHRWSVWAIGDCANFGIEQFGEEAYAAFEGPHDRYDVVGRLLGLHPDTVRNYASLAARVAKSRRRVELPALTHEPVAKLDPAEQSRYLQMAVDENMTREELRVAINGARNGSGGGGLGRRDRIMVSAEHVAHCARKAVEVAERVDDDYLVPGRIWEELVAAVTEDD